MFRTITIEAKSLIMTAEGIKEVVDHDLQEISKMLPINHWLEYDGVIIDSIAAQKELSSKSIWRLI